MADKETINPKLYIICQDATILATRDVQEWKELAKFKADNSSLFVYNDTNKYYFHTFFLMKKNIQELKSTRCETQQGSLLKMLYYGKHVI